MPFNPTLNLLRAIAVLLVMLYHFVPKLVPGGYIGVDVFFVISGYLMTAIIFSGFNTGQFSLLSFYAARARRILPALLGLGVALGVLGYCFLPLDEYRLLLRTVKNSLQFTSNIQFAAKGSYFASPLQENWLLHTWSLSLEWQFYLIYPLLLTLAAKVISLRQMACWLLPALALVSLLAAMYFTGITEQWAFYMLPTRAWELLAGGLVYCHAPRITAQLARYLSITGLAALALATFLLNDSYPWPGYLANAPVMATVLVILGTRLPEGGVTRPLHWLGTRSYSVYLWHWPIVVLLYTCGLRNEAAAISAGLLAAVILGALSWQLLERRSSPAASPKRALLVWCGCAALGIALSASTGSLLKKGFDLRPWFVEPTPPQYASKLFSQRCEANPWNADECVLGEGPVNVILMGDSHSQSTAAAVQHNNPGAAQLWALGACPTLLAFEMRNQDKAQKCRAFNADKVQRLARDYPGVPLILFSRSSSYITAAHSGSVGWPDAPYPQAPGYAQRYVDTYARTVCALGRNRPLYIVRPIPEMPFDVYKSLDLQARLFGRSTDITLPLSIHRQNHVLANTAIDTAAAQCQATVIDTTARLCPRGVCMGSVKGISLYYDNNHLVDDGNRVLMGLFDRVVGK